MKRLVLATTIAAVSVATAHAEPTLYGRLFLKLSGSTYEAYTFHNPGRKTIQDRPLMSSLDSYLGFKGSEALNADTDLIYQLEYSVSISDKSDGILLPPPETRESYLGLASKKYGTLKVGRLDAIEEKVDYANVVAVNPFFTQNALGGYDALDAFKSFAVSNSISYTSPKIKGWTASAMYTMDENTKGAPDAIVHPVEGNYDSFGLALQYEPEDQNFRAGLSYAQVGGYQIMRASGAVDVTPKVTVGALHQRIDVDDKNYGDYKEPPERAYALSTTVKTESPWTFYGQADFVKDAYHAEDLEIQRYSVGGKYAFNQNTTGHVYGAYARTSESRGHTTNATGVGVGLEYKF